MTIYCLSTFTGISDYCGFCGNRIVSKKCAIDDYVNDTKERIIFLLSKKPYLRQYSVFIDVIIKQNDDDGVFRSTSRYQIVIQINSDNSFNISRKQL